MCKECGFVTKNIPSSHTCTTVAEFLKDKDVEVIKRLHKTKHLEKHFKQKADKEIFLSRIRC